MSNGNENEKQKPNLPNTSVLAPVTLNAGLVPATMSEAFETAKLFAAGNLIPAALKGKPGDVLLVMLKGLELGLKPVQALSQIYIVDGKPGCSAQLKVALCLQQPKICTYFRLIESTDKKATYETQRAGSKPVQLSFTIEQASAAGLTGKNNWRSYPSAMLRARASSALADAVYPDLVQGVATLDELDEVRERVVTSSQAPMVVRNAVAPASQGADFVDAAPSIPPEPVEDWLTVEQPVETAPAEKERKLEIKDVETKPSEPSALEKVLIRIREATETKHLEALVNDIKALTKEEQLQVKKLYTDKRSELAGGKKAAS